MGLGRPVAWVTRPMLAEGLEYFSGAGLRVLKHVFNT
jgi:hypothetical protein